MTIADGVRQFLELVWGSMEGNVIVGLADRAGPKGKVNRFEDFKYPADLNKIVDWVGQHRNEDAYLSPLVYGDERNEDKTSPSYGHVRRTPENALYSNTAYQDSDTCEPQNFRLRPSIHVTSSTGRYQDYWLLTSPVPAQEAARMSHKIAIAHRDHGSDPSSWSANKVLRIPFTTNTRHGFPEDVTVAINGEIYSDMDVLGAYDDIELTEREPIRLPADVSYDSDQDLPDYAEAIDRLPQDFDLDILTKEVPDGVDRSRMRYRLLMDLFRIGTLTFEDVLSLAWHAPVSRKWKEDSRNIRGLIAEALKAQAEAAYEAGEGISGPEANELPSRGQWDVDLLTDDERASIAGDDNWLNRWDEWNRAKLGAAYNRPYVMANGITILSTAFSDCCFMPMSNGEEGTNTYVMALGDSGSGKSSSWKLWREMMRELNPEDKAWNIGANASPNALHEALLNRDNKVSVFNSDEARGWFAQLAAGQGNWTAGILENLALYYDGYVPPMLRTGNRDISGKEARAHFLMHLMGTRKGKMSITNVLTDDMILSGFLARFIWYIGEDKEVNESAMAVNMTHDDYVVMGYQPMCRQWAAEFADTKKKLRMRTKHPRSAIQWDRDALLRVGKMKWSIDQTFRDKHQRWELLDPSLRRIGSNMMRVATLLAVEDGSDTVTMRYCLVAMEMAEEWLRNVVTMTENISESDWKRQCDDIVKFIESKGQRSRLEVVLRKFSSRKGRELQEQINDLKAQGRIQEIPEKGVKWLHLKTT